MVGLTADSIVGDNASYFKPGPGIAALIVGEVDKVEVYTDPGSEGAKWSSSCHVLAEKPQC